MAGELKPSTAKEEARFTYLGGKTLYVNQSCRWFERFIVSKDIDNVVII